MQQTDTSNLGRFNFFTNHLKSAAKKAKKNPHPNRCIRLRVPQTDSHSGQACVVLPPSASGFKNCLISRYKYLLRL